MNLQLMQSLTLYIFLLIKTKLNAVGIPFKMPWYIKKAKHWYTLGSNEILTYEDNAKVTMSLTLIYCSLEKRFH